MEKKKETQVEKAPTPETTNDIETVKELARRAITVYSPTRGRIDEIRASGWYDPSDDFNE